MLRNLVGRREQEREEYWISISDMMAGLMMIFLFISVVYMLNVKKDKDKITQIAVTYERIKLELYKDLEKEFKNDLVKWNAILDRPTLSIRFREPEVLFKAGKVEVRPKFKMILDDFFPRYINILMSPKYINDIQEVRIEGHTSSEWMAVTDEEEAYIWNMELSQGRTRSVLQYIFSIPYIAERKEVKHWLREHLTANGLSSSKLIYYPDGRENKRESRRVEFRVRTNAEKRIVDIIKRT